MSSRDTKERLAEIMGAKPSEVTLLPNNFFLLKAENYQFGTLYRDGPNLVDGIRQYGTVGSIKTAKDLARDPKALVYWRHHYYKDLRSYDKLCNFGLPESEAESIVLNNSPEPKYFKKWMDE